MKQTLIILFIAIFSYNNCNAQVKKKSKYSSFVSKAKGDLNNDTVEDYVLVYKDLKTGEFQVQVYFTSTDGKGNLKLITFSNTAISIDSEFTSTFSKVLIKKGVIILSSDLLRGNFEYKFRYQNKNFELIGYTNTNSDGNGIMYTTDINLSTGIVYKKEENYETNEIIVETEEKVNFKPMPILNTFNPNNFYQ